MQLRHMRRYSGAVVSLVVMAGCSGERVFTFVDVTTACETRDWAEGRAELLDHDPAEAERFAQVRCFRVEPSVHVTIEAQPFGGRLRGSDRFVMVSVVGDTSLEHLASAELRRTLGLDPRSEGWVHVGDLVEVP